MKRDDSAQVVWLDSDNFWSFGAASINFSIEAVELIVNIIVNAAVLRKHIATAASVTGAASI